VTSDSVSLRDLTGVIKITLRPLCMYTYKCMGKVSLLTSFLQPLKQMNLSFSLKSDNTLLNAAFLSSTVDKLLLSTSFV